MAPALATASSSMPLSMPPSSSKAGIVQEYAPWPAGTTAKNITVGQVTGLDRRIEAEMERNGIEAPRGYTVSWHHDARVERSHFGPSHPMKPWRLHLTKNLIFAYGMHRAMRCARIRPATEQEMAAFHAEDYIEFLKTVTPENMQDLNLVKYNLGGDCPVFHGLYDFCTLSAGGSVDAARALNGKVSDIAINWSGGLHHAKKVEASGFCYINDIVLAILELLRFHARVLYIDIDVHHGDGVEQAFWSNDRVMTLSFHKYDKDNFFPGTGALESYGPRPSHRAGSHFSLNVPLKDGIEDADYVWLFKQVVEPTVRIYNPSAVVLQCGADSLGGDRLGCFNLNIEAHGACLGFVKSFGLPLLVLGGGGYTAANVARLWAYETGLCIGAHELRQDLPAHAPNRDVFGPDHSLLPRLGDATRRFENKNTQHYLFSLVQTIREYLRYVERSPSVHMDYVPPGIDRVRADVDRELDESFRDSDDGRRQLERGTGTGARGQLAA